MSMVMRIYLLLMDTSPRIFGGNSVLEMDATYLTVIGTLESFWHSWHFF